MGEIRTQAALVYAQGEKVSKAAARALMGVVEDQIAASALALVGLKTWIELSAILDASDNALAVVSSSDVGTHLDPVTDEVVPNGGYYRWNADAPGWERLSIGASPLVVLEPNEASTPGVLVFEPLPGSILGDSTGNNTVFFARLPYDKPAETGILLRIVGLGAELLQLQTLDGAQVPDAAYSAGDYVLFVRPGDGHWAALTFFTGNLGGAGGGSSGAMVYLRANLDASTPSSLVFEPYPGQTLTGNGEGRVFVAAMPFDRPSVEYGVHVTVTGLGEEIFQLQTLGGDQIPGGAYVAGDFVEFVRPEGAHYKALRFYDADLGQGTSDQAVMLAGAAADNASRAARRSRRTALGLAALSTALGYPTAYAGDDLTLDFANGFYQSGPQRTRALRALAGFGFTRAGARGERVGNARTQFFLGDVPAVVPGVGLWARQANTNLLLNSATLATQSVTLPASVATLSFIGTGSVTLSGAASGTLTGSSAKERVSLTFTPTAGSVTFTVSGSVKLATLFAGALPGPVVVTGAATATAAADALSLSHSLDDEPWFVMIKVDLQQAGTTARLLCVNDGNSSNYLLFARTAGNAFDLRAVVGGAQQPIGLPTNPGSNTTGVCVVGLRRDAAGRYSAAWRRTDGTVLVGAPGAVAPMPPGLCRVDPGNFFGSDQPQSPVSLVRILRADLTDGEISTLLGAA